MAVRFVNRKTARLYRAAAGAGSASILIFGDQVNTSGAAVGSRTPVKFRDLAGFIDTTALTTKAPLEVYFIDVGQGDSAFIVTPGRKKILIDGGINNRALGFLSWKYRLDKPASPPLVIDLVVVSHADSDHLAGLVPIVEFPKIDVREIIHSGIATYAAGAFGTSLGDLKTDDGRQVLITRHNLAADLPAVGLNRGFSNWRSAIVGEAGVRYFAVDTTTGVLPFPDPSLGIEVLGPRLVPAAPGQGMGYPWFGDPAHTINGNSVVLRMVHGDVRILFSGDLNIEGSLHLLDDPTMAERLDAHVLKAPHHGSHEFHPPFLDAVRPQIAVISSGDDPDHGHPRASFTGAIGRATRSERPLVFSTEIAEDFTEINEPRIAADAPTLEAVDLTQPNPAAELRRVFKRRLHGMINVRSDGKRLYSARRVTAGYMWEAYGPDTPVPRWQVR